LDSYGKIKSKNSRIMRFFCMYIGNKFHKNYEINYIVRQDSFSGLRKIDTGGAWRSGHWHVVRLFFVTKHFPHKDFKWTVP